MNDYIEEVDNNFDEFFENVKASSLAGFDYLDNYKDCFKRSNRILVSLQAWNSELISHESSKAKFFFLEAQNDVLMSHALARQGAWRVALMSLRSSIENVLFGLFYLDHSVELQLWELGKHKLGFTEVKNYLKVHPAFINISDNVNGLANLGKEYATLSKAVHGSSTLFRVTRNGQVEGLNILSKEDLNKWKSRETETIKLLNMVMLTFFKEKLNGAALPNLRKAISLAIPQSLFGDIRTTLKVRLTSVS